jgi:hydrogenase/urease accessory protein HupE
VSASLRISVALPAVEPMIAASLLVTGLLVVSRLRVPGSSCSMASRTSCRVGIVDLVFIVRPFSLS